jgi:hypothetical protein
MSEGVMVTAGSVTAGNCGALRRAPHSVVLVRVCLLFIECAQESREHFAYEHALVLAAPILWVRYGTSVTGNAKVDADFIGRTARNAQVVRELSATTARAFSNIRRH